MPIILQQSYIFPTTVRTATVTITERGITHKTLLFGLQTGYIWSLPKNFLDPRRKFLPTQQDREEGLHPYIPELTANPLAFINYNQTGKYLMTKKTLKRFPFEGHKSKTKVIEQTEVTGIVIPPPHGDKQANKDSCLPRGIKEANGDNCPPYENTQANGDSCSPTRIGEKTQIVVLPSKQPSLTIIEELKLLSYQVRTESSRDEIYLHLYKCSVPSSVSSINGVYTAGSGLESTCLVFAYGLDLYWTRITPSRMFDVLKEDFDYWFILGTLGILVLVTIVSQRLASIKMLRQAWQ